MLIAAILSVWIISITKRALTMEGEGEPKSKSMNCYLHLCPPSEEGGSGGKFGLPELTLAFQKAVSKLLDPESDLYVKQGRTPEETVKTVNRSIDTKWVGGRGTEYYKNGARVKTHPIPQFVDLASATTLQHNHKPPKGPGGKTCVVFLVEGIEIKDEHELERVASELARLWVGVYGPCVEQSLLERRFPTPECCPNPNCMEYLCTGFHLRVLSIPNQQLVAAAFIEKLEEDLNAEGKPVIKKGTLYITQWKRYASEVLGMETGHAPVVPDFEAQLLKLRDGVASSTAAAAAAGARVDEVARHIGERVNAVDARVDARVDEVDARVNFILGDLDAVVARVDAVDARVDAVDARVNFILGDLDAALQNLHDMRSRLQVQGDRLAQLFPVAPPMMHSTGAMMFPPGPMVHMTQPLTVPQLTAFHSYPSPTLSSAWHSPTPVVAPICPDCRAYHLTRGIACNFKICKDQSCKGSHTSGCDWLSCSGCNYSCVDHLSTSAESTGCRHARCRR